MDEQKQINGWMNEANIQPKKHNAFTNNVGQQRHKNLLLSAIRLISSRRINNAQDYTSSVMMASEFCSRAFSLIRPFSFVTSSA